MHISYIFLYFLSLLARSLSLDNTIGIRATRDAVRFYDPKNENAAKLPITRWLLVAVRNSHAAYKVRLARKQELEKKKRAKEAADAIHKEEQRQQTAEKVALQQQDEELVKKQHEALKILKAAC